MIYIIAFLLTFFLTFLVRKLAIKKSLMDIPNERSSHSIPTPRGGGIAIVLVWYLALCYFYYRGFIEQKLFFALLPGIILSAIGFLDDIFSLSPKFRLFSQALVGVLALYFLGGLQKIDLGFFVFDNVYFLSFFAFFGIIWFINLFNFLDGIDGYEASEVIFISLALFYFTKNSATLLLVAVCLGFLLWNWQKAKIFMGDVGSTLLGYTIAVFIIYFQNYENFSLITSLILSSVFWFDATLTLIRRKLNGEKLSQAHKKHAYQRLTQAGWTHAKVCLYAILINVLLFVLVYYLTNIWASFLVCIVLLFGVMRFVDSKKKFEKKVFYRLKDFLKEFEISKKYKIKGIKLGKDGKANGDFSKVLKLNEHKKAKEGDFFVFGEEGENKEFHVHGELTIKLNKDNRYTYLVFKKTSSFLEYCNISISSGFDVIVMNKIEKI